MNDQDLVGQELHDAAVGRLRERNRNSGRLDEDFDSADYLKAIEEVRPGVTTALTSTPDGVLEAALARGAITTLQAAAWRQKWADDPEPEDAVKAEAWAERREREIAIVNAFESDPKFTFEAHGQVTYADEAGQALHVRAEQILSEAGKREYGEEDYIRAIEQAQKEER